MKAVKNPSRLQTRLIAALFAIGFAVHALAEDPWNQAEAIVKAIEVPEIPERSFNIRDLGAAGDGKQDDLPALQGAINICNHGGGGRVVVPAGVYWLEGPIRLKSNVELHLAEGSTLRFSGQPADFLPVVFTRWEGTEMFGYSPFIHANDATNIAITGSGTIDGNVGETFAKWRELQKKDQLSLRTMGDNAVPVAKRIFGEGHFLRPSFIQFINCSKVKIEGVKIIDSPFWVIHPVYSSHVTIRDVSVESLRLNNDGVDIDSSTHVVVEKCTFRTGDDAVAIKSGRDRDGRERGRPSSNIIIRNNTCLDVHNGIAIGSEMSGSVRNVFIEDCTVKSGRNLIYFKSSLDRGGIIENVHVRNIKVGKAEQNLIRFQTDYFGYRGGKCPPTFRNFRIENISCKQADHGIRVEGHPDAPIKDVVIRKVTIENAKIPVLINEHDQVELSEILINGQVLGDEKE
jgi:polygalacturonase